MSGCSKDALIPNPPIEPGAYLPVYPGSYWTYQKKNYGLTDTFIDTITEESPPEYILHYLRNPEGTDSTANYVPYWQGMPLYKYSFPVFFKSYGSSQSGHKLLDYLSETIPSSSTYGSNQYVHTFAYVSGRWNSLTVGQTNYQDVIEVDKYYDHVSYGECVSSTRFYARNVGLEKEISFFLYSTDTATVIDLIDHHINKQLKFSCPGT